MNFFDTLRFYMMSRYTQQRTGRKLSEFDNKNTMISFWLKLQACEWNMKIFFFNGGSQDVSLVGLINFMKVFIFLDARIIFARGTSHLLFSAWSSNL